MKKYDFLKIERKWRGFWQKEKIYESDFKNAKKPFYNLMMFPYLSAEGLHVGNTYAFVGSDIYGRMKRMQGYDVFEPVGLDGFGIHSENYALKIGAHPMKQAKISEKRFYKQLESIGNGFAWDEKLETYDPAYYKWTQWIFVQMFKHGLAYRKKAAVNWCPSCKTVLADEQVISGKCERCSSVVEKKELEQWFFKITKYVDKLLKNLDTIDWSERVKIAQRNWIGKSEGALIKFKVKSSKLKDKTIEIFTTRPDTIFGATYMVLAPEHSLIENLKLKIENWDEVRAYIKKSVGKSEAERVAEGRDKTGVELKGIEAINPASGEKIPVWVADYVLGSYGTGAIMAVPAHDERDAEFAKKFDLPISNEPLVSSEEAIRKSRGVKKIQYRLRDWLISRQRYWGAPIPMIYCLGRSGASAKAAESCGWQPVAEKDLPVKLPFVKNFQPKGKGTSPLASVRSFYETKCPKCGGKARRETDVSDTFLDSAWYYLRYPSTHSARSGKVSWDEEITKKWLPVDLYTGGAEHSVLHLLYSRFFGMVFTDWGLVDFPNGEPFPKFRAHGLIIKEGAKMSKSKGNIINPDEYIEKFGADTLRMYLMFIAPFEQGGDFRDTGILGITRFLERAWNLFSRPKDQVPKFGAPDVERLLHKTIKKVTEDIESLRYNTAISALMILLNEMEKNNLQLTTNNLKLFLKLLAPFAPYMTEEIWRNILGNKKSIHLSAWPEYDPELIEEKEFDLVVQINGRHKDTVRASVDIGEKDAKTLALRSPRVQDFLKGRPVQKTIYVKNRLINFVI